jgi:HNH endonuclease
LTTGELDLLQDAFTKVERRDKVVTKFLIAELLPDFSYRDIDSFLSTVVWRHRGKNKHPSDLLRQQVYARDNFSCVYCSSKESLTLDHVIPKSKDGDNSLSNLATCCKKCNQLKQDMMLEDWLLVLNNLPKQEKT